MAKNYNICLYIMHIDFIFSMWYYKTTIKNTKQQKRGYTMYIIIMIIVGVFAIINVKYADRLSDVIFHIHW